MLVYRLLDANKNLSGFNEIDAYSKGYLTPNGSSRSNALSGINTFDYKENRYCHHFFLFSEDAIKFSSYDKDKRNTSDLKIGEFELAEDLFVKYSGFGIYNSFNCSFGPTIEVCIPQNKKNMIYMKKSQILSDDSTSLVETEDEEEIKKYIMQVQQQHYFMFQGMETTEQLFCLNDSRLKSTYRKEIYQLYCKKAWREFIEAYGIIYDEKENKFKNFTEFTDDERILENRQKVLRKYKILN